jgi:hypothetical protein
LDISDWIEEFKDEQFLLQCTEAFKYVHLTLRNVQGLDVSMCNLLSSVLGSKLIGLQIEECQDVSWSGEIRKLLAHSKSLEVLVLKNNNWVDDFAMEQIAVRFQKSLYHLEIIQSQISNNALFQVGKRCTLIQILHLVCCPKITDAGLIEMAKNSIRVSVLNISHNLKISDKGIEALITGCKELKSLTLTNCPKLTNQAVASLYEITASWGRKRNVESEPLLHFEMQDNYNVTAEMLLWISACLPNLQRLDLRECGALNLVKGGNEIISMKTITDLRLGASTSRVDSGKFLLCMLYQAPQLVTLHLVGIHGFSDEHLGELIEQAVNLNDLHLVDVDFGTATVESICSNIPNIEKLVLSGSNSYQDADMRCLTTICRNLLELTVQRCPLLSNSAFTRLASCRHIRKFDIADICLPYYPPTTAPVATSKASKKGSSLAGTAPIPPRGVCDDGVLQFLTLAPLTSLCIDGLRFSDSSDGNAATGFYSLLKSTTTSLKTLSLKRCEKFSMRALKYVAENFVGCHTIDVTGCPHLPPGSSPDPSMETLGNAQFANPFLTFEQTSEFTGYRLTIAGRVKFAQYWAHRWQMRRHYGAKLMQRLRRKYLLRLLELKQFRRERWTDFKLQQLVRIQAVVRRYLVHKRVQRKIRCGRALVAAARNFLVYRQYLQNRWMRKHYKRYLKYRILRWLQRHKANCRAEHKQKVATLRESKRKRDLKMTFKTLKRMKIEIKERKFEDCAGAFHEVHFLMRILKHWKTVVFETVNKNQRLARHFLHCCDYSTYNSSRQLLHRVVADSFQRQRILMISWLCLARDYLVVKRINSMVPIAIDNFNRKFFRRVCGAIFDAFDRYRNNRLVKREAKAKGEQFHVFYRNLIACRKMDVRMLYRRTARGIMNSVLNQRRSYLRRLAFDARFPTFVRHTLYYKSQVVMVKQYVRDRTVFYSFYKFMFNIVEMKKWRIILKNGENLRMKIYTRFTFRAWNLFRANSKNMGALYYKRYLQNLQRKVIFGFRMNTAMSKELVRGIALEVEKRTGDAGGFAKFIKQMVRLQSKVRAVRQRMKFNEEKIQKLYSIQLLQNFFRTCLARKEYAGRFRKREIADRVVEDTELDLMREAEVETRYYNYRLRAIINFQRIFRGWQGRKLAAIAAVIFYRDISRDYYSTNHHNRLRHEAFKRAAIAREHMRQHNAGQIQKRVRGMQARVRFVEVKRKAKMARYAVYVQREYRRRLAYLKLQGMKRDMKSEIRFKAARKQRGFVMRLFGFRTRKAQSSFGKVLDEVGMDPLSFNYRVGELVAETIADFKNLVGIFKRERALVEEHGLNRIALAVGRRRVLFNQGWKLKIQDAVRIVEKGHKFEGYTGVISRIDETLLGVPLYEIKLDKFNRQTFARMTTDAFNTYAFSQPLSKIQIKPKLLEYEYPEVIFGLDNTDPFFSKKNVNAAWTLQRAFRIFRAKKIASRKRYELWLRSAGRQWSLLNHMAETNTMNMQAHNVAGLLRVRPKKPIFFDEIRHTFMPQRLLSNVTKEAESVAIKREFDVKLRDRMTYLQKCAIMQGREFFHIGYEKMSSNRKVTVFSNILYGMMFKKRAQGASAPTGAKGVKFLTKQSLVTGLDMYSFDQFQGSPHVRYYKVGLMLVMCMLLFIRVWIFFSYCFGF